jgi:N-acetylmuramoyl-L-alanine amidase
MLPKLNFIIVLLLIGLFPGFTYANTLDVLFGDSKSRYTLYSSLEGEKEYIPLNQVIQVFNLTRTWDSLNGMVILGYRGKTGAFKPDQTDIIVERRTFLLKNPPKYIEGILMIPLEFIIDVLPLFYDKEISWDPSRRLLKVGSGHIEITSVQHAVYNDYTRIIVQTNKPVTYKVVEKLPALLIVDLPESSFSLSNNPVQVGSNSVKIVKIINSYGTTQVLVNLSPQFINYDHFALNDPPRIVIDVHGIPGDEDLAKKQVEELSTPIPLPLDDTSNLAQILPKIRTPTTVKTVIIDPGHGGRDKGIAIGPDLWEKDITLVIAQKLSEALRRRLGVRVVLTRTGNDNLSPVERATLANSTRADLLISLHLNNSFSSSTQGFEVYTLDIASNQDTTHAESPLVRAAALDHAQEFYLDKSERVADYVVTAYNEETKSKEGKKKKAPLLILKGVTMPAIQIEMGYLSSTTNKAKFIQEDFQKLMVKVLTEGIINFKRYLEQVSLN